MKIERLPNNSVKVTIRADEAMFRSQRMEFVLAPGEEYSFAHMDPSSVFKSERIADPDVIIRQFGGVVTVKNLQSAYTPYSEPTRTTETQQKIDLIKKLLEELPNDDDRWEATEDLDRRPSD